MSSGKKTAGITGGGGIIRRKLLEIAPPSASRARPAPDARVWHLTLDQIESGSGRIGRRVYGLASEAGSSTFAFDEGNVLYSKLRPYLNKVICPDRKGIATTELVPLRPSPSELNREYLCLYLRSPEFVSWATKQVDGAKMPRMKMKSFWVYEIPVPRINDQIRIAHLLGKVEGLIAQRKQQLQQLDDLLKSVFLDMFGDPVRNEKGWDIHPCENAVLDVSSGTSYGGEDRAFASPDEIGVLKISAVTKGRFDPNEFKVVNPTHITKPLRFVKRGDFLFSRANTVELVAACCIVPQDYDQLFIPDKLWILALNTELLNAPFFNHLLKNDRYRDVVRSLASGGHDSMLNISMKKFMTLDVPCPPIRIQNDFATIVDRAEDLKSRYQQSLTDLETLYGALSQRAFKGELDLSHVPLVRAVQAPSPVESVAPDASNVQYMLPDLPAGYSLTPGAKRRSALGFWFSEYCKNLAADKKFTLDVFVDKVNFRLAAMDDAESEFRTDDYDHLKTLLFEALDSGALVQRFDEASNQVALHVQPHKNRDQTPRPQSRTSRAKRA